MRLRTILSMLLVFVLGFVAKAQNTPFVPSTEGNETWYYICYNETGRHGPQLPDGSWGYLGDDLTFSTAQDKGDAQLWKFVANGNGAYHIVSKNGNYILPANTISKSQTVPDKAWTFDASSTSGLYVIYNGSVPCQMHANKDTRLVNWGYNSESNNSGARKNDAGCNFKFIDADIESDVEVTYPIDEYEEPRVGTTPNTAEWNAIPDGLNASWASRDVHYRLHEVPQLVVKESATLRAWKGERANIQALLFSKTDQGTMTVRMTEWKKGGVATGVNAGDARFVNYVITDDYVACGNHPTNLPQWLVADVIDQDKPHAVPAMETRPVWCTLEIPRDIEAGEYTTALEILNEDDEIVKSLNLNVVVDTHSLPTVSEQKFHLDFWQQPYAVSRYYGVERWSDEHLDALRPYLQALGRAGQRTVSAILFYEPWGEQTHDLFDPMVQTIKKADGTWAYDYTVFDKYVELCAEYGIDKQINCFSMVPWDMNFRYFDEATNEYKFIKTTTSADEYKNLWNSFLAAFKAHLQQKEWFDKTNIAMDERGLGDMQNAYDIASAHGFKMALAGNYHTELSRKLRDYCVALGQYFTADELAYRKENGYITTIYTSCADSEPNIYTNSYPAEATFLPLHAAAIGFNGYLHWAWINWDEHPLTDSRFRKFGSGDTYCYYPGNRSSVRFERLIEGIHQYEKVQILKEEYKDNAEKLETLNALLKLFESHTIAGEQCAAVVDKMEAFLNGQDVTIPKPENVTTGYYHIINKDASRDEHLYNDATLAANSMRFTLQSSSMVNSNNGIWHITVKDNNKLGIKNGDGNPVVAGANWGSSIDGSYKELSVGLTEDVGEYRYYFFTEAINCTNGGDNFKVGGVSFVTTWTDGGAKPDNMWRFEPVDMEGMSVYNVEIEENPDVYLIFRNGLMNDKAFNGGFFITSGQVTADKLSVGMVGNVLKKADITIEGNTIKVTNVEMLPEPVKQDLYNTSNGDGKIPPYRIPGITTASNGRLITAAARLVCGTDPGYGQVDIVCRYSDNDGETWSDMIDVAVGTGKTSATVNYFDTAFGDPAIVADRTSREILIIAVAGCTVYGNSNTTRQNPNMIATIHSKDNGETWETPVNVTEDIYSLFDAGNTIQSAFVGGGKIFQSRIVKKDKYYRLYAAMCARPNGNRVVYSDDFGRTWHALGGASALPAPGGDEPKCEEMPDGRVILSSRVGGGRIYNIYTYSNTLTGEGSWATSVKSTFSGSGLTPGGNSTNGEILVVPVKRNSDNKEMYLALQSLPTGSGRTNVGIFYKELADVNDINSVDNFAVDWNGFFQVSTTSSAYSSMDLQADNRIGFIYEETLTGFGKRDNPVSTSFPNGSGQHNFDGFDNIYVAYDLELITNGAYSIKNDVDRREFIRNYFTAVAKDTDADTKAAVVSALAQLTENPTTEEIDNVYKLLKGVEPADKWDGKLLTFTNVQQNGKERTLYVDENNVLNISESSADELGTAAQFRCTKYDDGKYSFYNEEKGLYMIWRAGKDYGYNNNAGTMASYNATYCNWDIKSGSISGTYYMVSKRKDGTDDGAIIVLSSGVFDSWSDSEGYTADYSNLFRIDVVEEKEDGGDIETSIVGIDGNICGDATVYDLFGRKIENPLKGIYIIDGKKVLVK